MASAADDGGIVEVVFPPLRRRVVVVGSTGIRRTVYSLDGQHWGSDRADAVAMAEKAAQLIRHGHDGLFAERVRRARAAKNGDDAK